MPGKPSKRLVIDASIARAAGGQDATFPTSKHCRDLLIAVKEICHRVVMTPEITAEWDQHQSRFARTWRVSMAARRKVIQAYGIVPDEALRGKISRTALSPHEREAMLKDCCLIEAARATDRIVLSLDETVRGLLQIVARQVGELRQVIWANPNIAAEQCDVWLANGANPEPWRRLGSSTRHGCT